MRARDCVWPQPNDFVSGRSIQLTRKLADYWVNLVEQEQVRRGRDRNRKIPNRDASPARGALPPNPVSIEMQNLWPPLPGLGERGCGQSLADKPNHAQRLAGNRQERS